MSTKHIYHLARKEDWQKRTKVYTGSTIDRKDGFLHFSTSKSIKKSAELHRAGEKDLLLLKVSLEKLKGKDLRWEKSISRGEEFPHLYEDLPVDAVVEVTELPLDNQNKHIFPLNLED